MNSKNKINLSFVFEHLTAIGVMFAAGFWLVDIMIDALFFNEGTMIGQLLAPEPMEVYFRLLVGSLFVVFGYLAQSMLVKQKQLKTDTELKARLLDEVNDAVVAHDLNGNFIYANAAAGRMGGVKKGSSANSSRSELRGLMSEAKNSGVLMEKLKELEQKGSLTFEMTGRREDQSELFTEVHASLMNMEGKTIVLSVARDVTQRHQQEQARNSLLKELQTALGKIKTLRGLIPICANCKKIRNDEGFWQQVEEYVSEHTEADFTFGICEDCLGKLYPEFSGGKGKDGHKRWHKNDK
ncbi:PAS domain S-box protein [candidate division TA06 bacterium]|nr:PAS domain S-box protein [candidate division TA06 bacterium]